MKWIETQSLELTKLSALRAVVIWLNNAEKFISSYRRNNMTIDNRDNKLSNFLPTEKQKKNKNRMKSITDNYISIESAKSTAKNGNISNWTMDKSLIKAFNTLFKSTRDRSSVK